MAMGLSACRLGSPPQDNFLVDASGMGGATLAQNLSAALNAHLTSADINLPDSDKAQIFRLDGPGYMVILTPLPDDRCNPQASFQSTYKEQSFGADLVYESTSRQIREVAKQRFINAVKKLNVPISEFRECK